MSSTVLFNSCELREAGTYNEGISTEGFSSTIHKLTTFFDLFFYEIVVTFFDRDLVRSFKIHFCVYIP